MNPDLGKPNQENIQKARNESSRTTGDRQRDEHIRKTREATREMGGADRLRSTREKPNISSERIDHNINKNLQEMDPKERQRVQGRVDLGKKLGETGYESLDKRTQEAIVKALCEKLAKSPDAKQRFPGFNGKNPFGHPEIYKQAAAMASTEKYRALVIKALDRIDGEGEDGIKGVEDSLDQLELDLDKAAADRKVKEQQYTLAENDRKEIAGKLASFDESNTDPSSKYKQLEQAKQEADATWKPQLAAAKTKAELADNKMKALQRRSGFNRGGGLSDADQQAFNDAEDELIKAKKEESEAESKIKRVADLEAEHVRLRQELAAATGRVGDLETAKVEAVSKHALAQKAKTGSEMERRVKEKEYAKKLDVLTVAADEYDEDVLNELIQKEEAYINEQTAKAQSEAEEKFYKGFGTRWGKILNKPRLGLKGGIGHKDYREPAKIGTGEFKTAVDMNVLLNNGIDAYFKMYMAGETGMKSEDVQKFIDANPDRAANMKQELFKHLAQWATRDGAVNVQQLALVKNQPWFRETLKTAVKNNPELSSQISDEQLDTLLKAGTNPKQMNLLMAIFEAMTGVITAGAFKGLGGG